MMLLGTFRHTLDKKNRLIFPAKLREPFHNSFNIVFALEGTHLCVYTDEVYMQMAERLDEVPYAQRQALENWLFADAETVTSDDQGRVVLSQEMRDKANLQQGAGLVVLGKRNHVEIWDEASYEAFRKTESAQDVLKAAVEFNIL